MTASADTIAAWMLVQLKTAGCLYQDDIAGRIAHQFGGEATYTNNNGNVAISKPILDAFRKLTGDTVVWVRSERYWRPRELGDSPSRQQ